jgi:hypothetical protein
MRKSPAYMKRAPTHDPYYPLSRNEEAIITTIEAAAGIEYKGCYNREHPKGIGILTHFVFDIGGGFRILTHKEMKFFLKNNYFINDPEKVMK